MAKSGLRGTCRPSFAPPRPATGLSTVFSLNGARLRAFNQLRRPVRRAPGRAPPPFSGRVALVAQPSSLRTHPSPASIPSPNSFALPPRCILVPLAPASTASSSPSGPLAGRPSHWPPRQSSARVAPTHFPHRGRAPIAVLVVLTLSSPPSYPPEVTSSIDLHTHLDRWAPSPVEIGQNGVQIFVERRRCRAALKELLYPWLRVSRRSEVGSRAKAPPFANLLLSRRYRGTRMAQRTQHAHRFNNQASPAGSTQLSGILPHFHFAPVLALALGG